MPYLGIFGLESKNNIIKFKSVPSNLSNCKISLKIKNT